VYKIQQLIKRHFFFTDTALQIGPGYEHVIYFICFIELCNEVVL